MKYFTFWRIYTYINCINLNNLMLNVNCLCRYKYSNRHHVQSCLLYIQVLNVLFKFRHLILHRPILGFFIGRTMTFDNVNYWRSDYLLIVDSSIEYLMFFSYFQFPLFYKEIHRDHNFLIINSLLLTSCHRFMKWRQRWPKMAVCWSAKQIYLLQWKHSSSLASVLEFKNRC